MKRINPLAVESAAPESANAETARLDNEVPGMCPICAAEGAEPAQMPIVKANGIPAYVCQNHCVCLPVEDGNPVFRE